MLQLGVCKTGNRLGTPPEPPQAGAYISQDTPEHTPDGTDSPRNTLNNKN